MIFNRSLKIFKLAIDGLRATKKKTEKPAISYRWYVDVHSASCIAYSVQTVEPVFPLLVRSSRSSASYKVISRQLYLVLPKKVVDLKMLRFPDPFISG